MIATADRFACGTTPQAERLQHQRACRAYRDERTGSFEFRTQRYKAVYDQLVATGLTHSDVIWDVGAGNCEFARYAYTLRGHRGAIYGVDGLADGTDLDVWSPAGPAEWFVAIEVIEHLDDPGRLVAALVANATKGVVLTTPNPETTDVLAMDATHKVAITPAFFVLHGFLYREAGYFGRERDSFLAWRHGEAGHLRRLGYLTTP